MHTTIKPHRDEDTLEKLANCSKKNKIVSPTAIKCSGFFVY